MEKLNLVKILKDCPKGTKLYSPALGECALEGVNDNNDYPIKVTYKIINNDTRFDYFTKDGYLLLNKPDAECMLFPSKDQRDWSKWHRHFKDGDIVYLDFGHYYKITIFKRQYREFLYYHASLRDNNVLSINTDNSNICTICTSYLKEIRFATEKEKAELFQVIKDNGYKWNAEEKKLEKLEDMEDKGNISDGYHTFNELYEYRLLYNASMFNELAKQGLYDVHKSKKHSDGTIPFGDENWFIVQAELPTGQISNHYEMKDWDLFKIPEKEKANPYDGHTPKDVAKRLRDFLTLDKSIVPKFKDEDKNHRWTIQDAKEGDVLAINWYEGYDYWEKIVIFKKYHNEGATSPCVEGYGNTFKNRKLVLNDEVPYFSKTWTSCLEPATKEQRDFLFQKIKEAGYKWNTETKTLEKLIVPKFKVGDIIVKKDDPTKSWYVQGIDTYYTNHYCIITKGMFTNLYFKDQDEWELLETDTTPNFKVGDRIRYAGEDFPIKIIDIKNNQYHIECFCDKYNDYKNGIIPVSEQNNYILIPKFNPKTLKPFDKVLVRDNNTSIWINAFFGFYDIEITKKYPFVASGIYWTQCIPYEGNEHLLGTYEDCDEYYKNWL